MGKLKKINKYMSKKLSSKGLDQSVFDLNVPFRFDSIENRMYRLAFVHKPSKTIIVITNSNSVFYQIKSQLEASFNVYNISKDDYKQSWKRQKKEILKSLNTDLPQNVVPASVQTVMKGGLKETEVITTQINKKSKAINQNNSEINTLDTGHPFEVDIKHIGKTPGWLLHSGTSMIGFVAILLLAFSYFIKYPDKIVAKGYVYNDSPPVEHVIKKEGIIQEIYASNGTTVSEGDPIIYIQNDVNINDFSVFSEFLKKYQTIESAFDIPRITFPKGLELGQFSNQYSRLEVLWNELIQTLAENETRESIKTIEQKIIYKNKLSEVHNEDKRLLKEQLNLSDKNLKRFEQLNSIGTVSDIEKEREENNNIEILKRLNSSEKGVIENKISETQLLLDIQNLQEQRISRINSRYFEIQELIIVISQSIKSWKDDYFIYAEENGILQLGSETRSSFFLSKNETAFTIIPSNHQEQFVKLEIPSIGIGKIKVDDRVILKFNAFPYKEFGFITSKITKIHPLPKRKNEEYFYEVEVGLESTLVTNTGFNIPASPFTDLKAEVITKDYSILKRIAQKSSPLLD